jgi:glycosyltransferase involved in cell wall biosynthesis
VAAHPAPSVHLLGGVLGGLPPGQDHVHAIARRDVRKGVRFALFWLLFLARLHLRLWQLARREAFDVVVISVPKYELLWSVPLVRRHCKVLVIDVRDVPEFVDYSDHFEQFLPRGMARAAARIVRSFSTRGLMRRMQAADLISVANEGIRSRFDAMEEKVRLVSNGVDPAHFKPRDARQRRPGVPLQLVYMGNFATKDRFDWIYDVLPCLGDAVCVNLVGDGRQKPEVLHALARLGVPFQDHGIVAHALVPGVLERMDVGFLFRDAYANASIPVAFYEFASMNIPVLCNDVGISGPFVREHDCGFVVQSSHELLEILGELVRHPAALDRFSHLHRTAEAQFSREAQARRLFTELRQLLASSSARPALP